MLVLFLIEELADRAEVAQHLKLEDMKKISYLVASSWDEVESKPLVKFWSKLWPKIESLFFETEFESAEHDVIGTVDRNDADTNTKEFQDIFKQFAC